ncbi:hypothetical protein RhiirA1_477527 [Rhizophagus irregularis]|uniref:Uncharacterized protein n=1 Tax=Rhizophagus irregularis TaxID=588596 RepID=A0A2N0QTK7_9GLOM|nr:hypothetical protein RhiirA1_477527 [Rhizophagus irregularis]
MSAITIKFVINHKFTDASEVSIEELSQHAPEILNLLTSDDPLVNREKRCQAHVRLQKGYKYSKEQKTIKETAQHIVWDNLSERDVKAISHRSNRCHCRKICLEFFWQIENYPGKLG